MEVVTLRYFLVAAIGALLLAGCSTTNLPVGERAYDIIPAPSQQNRAADYKIGPLDILKVTVFQEEDLSFDEIPVDASGNVLFPLIGQVTVTGRTSIELASDIAARLGDRYLVDPQVSIIVSQSASQKVTVEGAVERPGVYPIEGQTTLLQAMALAEGPTETARLNEVIVFRTKEDGVYAAQFNLKDIRKGIQPNPEILGRDIVVVGDSFAKALFRDLLQLSPALASVFVQISRN
ncbi:hypothetical protein A8B75_05540 [Sphingomonadales bacterium EhC05]|nr:hypothetical protein A8B75_05540 [Sphingomonadales bacterium EhC05]